MVIPTPNINYLACCPPQPVIICFNFHDITLFFYLLVNFMVNFLTLKPDNDDLLFVFIVNIFNVQNGKGTWQGVISMSLLKNSDLLIHY